MKLRIMNVVGARPNFMKIAPIVNELHKQRGIEQALVHTGQHYDEKMSKLFFRELGLPQPNVYLGVGSANHGEQTGKIMIEFEKALLEYQPDLVIVVGDVNSTMACGLVAVKQGVKLAHVEAGLRSFDRTMPEEINRILTDQISDFLFITEKSAEKNLLREGIDPARIHMVGNVMIDSLCHHLRRARESKVLQRFRLKPLEFAVLTLHRPSNVDARADFIRILTALEEIQRDIKIVFPIHPRSRKRLDDFGLSDMLSRMPNFMVVDPVGYLDFHKLMSEAKFMLTDSGGIQEETTVLGTPCLTLRENTERPVTVTHGTNKLVGSDPKLIVQESRKILAGTAKKGKRPDLWDGKTAGRIVAVLEQSFRAAEAASSNGGKTAPAAVSV